MNIEEIDVPEIDAEILTLWDELSGGAAEPAPTEPAPTEPAPTEPAPTEPAPTEPAPTEPAPTEPAPTEPAPTESVDYEALYKKEREHVSTQNGRLRAAEQRIKDLQLQLDGVQPQTTVATQQTPAQEKDPNDEFLAKFAQDYDENIVKAVQLIAERRIQEALAGRVAPIEAAVSQQLEQSHTNAILAKHPDVYVIGESDAFMDWMQSRPAHLKPAYEQIYANGTPEQVIGMLDEYKQQNVTQPAAPRPTPAPAPAPTQGQNVPRRRGTVDPVADPTSEVDIEALWRELTGS